MADTQNKTINAAPKPGSITAMLGGGTTTAKGKAAELDLNLIDDNPWQHRSQLDEHELAELVASIRAKGLLQAVTVRKVDDRYQLISGHRRTAAFRVLAAESGGVAWSQIPATIRVATDDEMPVLALHENLARANPSDLDVARSLEKIQLRIGGSSDEVAAHANLDPSRVKRLLRIARAPKVILEGLDKGVLVELPGEDGAAPKKQRRQLDMMAALEFIRLHGGLMKRPGASEKKVGSRVATLVTRALLGNWGFRRVESEVSRVLEGKAETPDSTETAAPAFYQPTWVHTPAAFRAQLDLARVGSMEPTDKEKLKAALQAVLAAL